MLRNNDALSFKTFQTAGRYSKVRRSLNYGNMSSIRIGFGTFAIPALADQAGYPAGFSTFFFEEMLLVRKHQTHFFLP